MRKVLIDINVPRDVEESLDDLGFNTVYLTDEFDPGTDDDVLLSWIVSKGGFVVTRDKSFSRNEYRTIKIHGEKELSLIKQAVKGLLARDVYPAPIIQRQVL